jgi:hypothetical protein
MNSIQPPEPGYPAERAIHDPAPRQQNDSAIRLAQTHYLKVDALTNRLGVGLVAGETLGDDRQFDRLAGQISHLLGQDHDLVPFLIVGRSDLSGQHTPERVHRYVNLRLLAVLLSDLAGPSALSRVDWIVQPSAWAADRWRADHAEEVVNDDREAIRGQPVATLLVDHRPWGEFLEQIPSL